MGVQVETRDGILWATFIGHLSVDGGVDVLKGICNAATERRVPRLLLDFREAAFEITDPERYNIASSFAEYALGKLLPFRVAIVGHPPTINGFGSQVVSQLGVTTEAFPELKDAVAWLNRFSPEGWQLTP